MIKISNDADFKQALQGLDQAQQRIVACLFVEQVLGLSNDDRLDQAINSAKNSDASDEKISIALKSAKAATFDCHTRCGSEGNWTDQAGYFVGRATIAALTPLAQSKTGGPAWQAAMSCRMAQTSMLIDSDDTIPNNNDNEWQYNILSDYLNS